MRAAKQIDNYIAEIPDWRGEILAIIRKTIHQTDPKISEEWKWGSPVWSHEGLVCSASAFKNHVGLNFFQGAFLKNNSRLFNSGLESKKSRTVKFMEGDTVNEASLKALVLEAVNFNKSKKANSPK